MTEPEFQTATDLTRVRMLKSIIEDLDPSVGPVILDEEHAQLRRTARAWEQRLMETVSIRAARKPRALESAG